MHGITMVAVSGFSFKILFFLVWCWRVNLWHFSVWIIVGHLAVLGIFFELLWTKIWFPSLVFMVSACAGAGIYLHGLWYDPFGGTLSDNFIGTDMDKCCLTTGYTYQQICRFSMITGTCIDGLRYHWYIETCAGTSILLVPLMVIMLYILFFASVCCWFTCCYGCCQ